jgi:hypothetical protein
MDRNWKGREREPFERTTQELASNVNILLQLHVRNFNPSNPVGVGRVAQSV